MNLNKKLIIVVFAVIFASCSTNNNIQVTNDPKDWEDFWNSFKSGETLKNNEFDELTCYDTHTNKLENCQ